MGVNRAPSVAVAWARFQPRTVGLAKALDGDAVFIHSPRLAGRAALLPLRYLVAALATWSALRRHNADVVVAVAPPVFAPLLAWLWCALHRRRLIVDCHPPDAFDSRRWAWATPLLGFTLRRAHVALCHTPDDLARARARGARAELVIDDVPDRVEAAAGAGVPAVDVLVAGSFSGNEPVEAALDAARALPDIRFGFTGDETRLAPGLRERIPANVTLTGFLPYPRFLAALGAARVVSVLSGDEHIFTPRAAFEAVGMGRPLVLLDLRGVRATFGGAAVFTAAEPTAMAAAFRDALGRTDELAAASRHKAQELRMRRRAGLEALDASIAASRPRPRMLLLSQHSLRRLVITQRNALELAARGYDVDVVCTEGMSPDQIPPECEGRLRFHVLDLPHRRGNLGRYLFEYGTFLVWAIGRTTRLAMRRRYRAVLVDNLPDMLVFGAPLPRLRGAKLVFNMLELTPEMLTARLGGRRGRAINRVSRMVEALAIRLADEVLVVSEPCRRVLLGRGVPESKLRIVINTVDVPAETVRPPEPPSPPVLVTHGTLVERYGTHLAIAATDRLRERWPGVRLQVMGTGEDMPRLRRLTTELDLGACVDFTGNLPWLDVQRRIARATLGIVAVMPDKYGALLLPTKLLELSALGVPAVCARQPAIEAYFPDDALTYFTPGSVEELSAGIARLLLDPDLARRQGERAREVISGLSWERQRRVFLRAMGIDVDGPGRPTPEPAPRVLAGISAESAGSD